MATRTGLCLFVVWVCACSSLLQSLPEGDNLLITVNFKTFSVRGPATLKNNYLNRLCAALQCSYSQAVLPLWSSRWSRAVLLFIFLVTFCSPTTKSCDFFTVVFFTVVNGDNVDNPRVVLGYSRYYKVLVVVCEHWWI